MTDGFDGFVAASAGALRNLAYALTNSAADADDLLQATLERMARAWSSEIDQPLAYARKVMMHALASEKRRPRWRREILGPVPKAPVEETPPPSTDDRLVLFDALAGLPRRQREAVVLRYLEDLALDEVATLMGCSQGNVKRSAHDGLRALRSVLEVEYGTNAGRGVT